jgi:hypothetical protein
MNDINIKQNLPQFTELLKAQRIAYSQCKLYQILDLISLLLAIIAPIVGLINNDLINVLGATGVLWTIIYLVAESYRKAKTEEGAKIQEQFDTELYNLHWNEILCKNKISIDIRRDLAEKHQDNDLLDWYSKEIGDILPNEIAVLLCQRINFSWEINLRKNFVLFILAVLIIYYGMFFTFYICTNTGIYDILILISPSLSFLMYCVQNTLSLKTHIKSKNETLALIDHKISEYATQRILPTTNTLRQIQDVIFTERTVPEKIPDWFYFFHKKNNENRTDQLIISIKSNF